MCQGGIKLNHKDVVNNPGKIMAIKVCFGKVITKVNWTTTVVSTLQSRKRFMSEVVIGAIKSILKLNIDHKHKVEFSFDAKNEVSFFYPKLCIF